DEFPDAAARLRKLLVGALQQEARVSPSLHLLVPDSLRDLRRLGGQQEPRPVSRLGLEPIQRLGPDDAPGGLDVRLAPMKLPPSPRRRLHEISGLFDEREVRVRQLHLSMGLCQHGFERLSWIHALKQAVLRIARFRIIYETGEIMDWKLLFKRLLVGLL